MKAILFNVHDMIETPGFQGERIYNVNGIHLGPTGGEDVVELESLDKTDPSAHGKGQKMFVPQEMLTAGIEAGIYKHTPANELG